MASAHCGYTVLPADVAWWLSTTDLAQAQSKVRNLRKSHLLSTKERKVTDKTLVCALPYNLHNVDARKCVMDNWHILS